MKMIFLALIFLGLGIAQAAPVKLGALNHAGQGCLEGTIETVSSDTLRLKGFKVNAVAGQLARKSCTVSIPVEVREGYQAGFNLQHIKLRTMLPSQSQVQIHSEAFWAGQTGLVTDHILKGFQRRNQILQGQPDIAWSGCGQSGILRLNVSATLQNQSAASAATVTIQELALGYIDLTSEEPLLTYRKCEVI